jgi:hypothetical protein
MDFTSLAGNRQRLEKFQSFFEKICSDQIFIVKPA